jgi:hypothetical protein
LERVALHADLVMLARLGQALSRAREVVPLAAYLPPDSPDVELSDWRRWWKERGEDELRALLMAAWDPIGVKHAPIAADEYNSYMLPLARKLREGASADDVAAFLDAVETEEMGFAARGGNAPIAAEILRWYADSTGYFAKPS